MEYHAESKEAVLKVLESREGAGLSGEEVQARLERYGPNRLREKKPKTTLARFFEQFKDVMILILLAAAAISFGIACFEGNPREF